MMLNGLGGDLRGTNDTVLTCAVRDGEEEVVSRVLDLYPKEVELSTEFTQSLLCSAAMCDDPRVIDILLARFPITNGMWDNIVCCVKNNETLKVILRYSPDCDVMSFLNDFTISELTNRVDDEDIIPALVDHSARKRGCDRLTWAAIHNLEILVYFLNDKETCVQGRGDLYNELIAYKYPVPLLFAAVSILNGRGVKGPPELVDWSMSHVCGGAFDPIAKIISDQLNFF
jgi:hypothetical protein